MILYRTVLYGQLACSDKKKLLRLALNAKTVGRFILSKDRNSKFTEIIFTDSYFSHDKKKEEIEQRTIYKIPGKNINALLALPIKELKEKYYGL